MEDREIIALYHARSEEAIARTDEQYGDYCRSIAMRILHNELDVEECVSDTYWHAWNAIPPQNPLVCAYFSGALRAICRWVYLPNSTRKSAGKANCR